MKVRKSLFSLNCLLHENKLCGLSTGKVVEGIWLPGGKFMVCEGQFEKHGEGKLPWHHSVCVTLFHITGK